MKHYSKLIISLLFLNISIFNFAYSSVENIENKKQVNFEYETSNKVPEGFSDILDSINYGFIDIYFANKYFGSFQSEYNYDTITFLESDILFNSLSKEVSFININLIKEILSKPMPLNTEYNCINNNECKIYSPEHIGLIFNENELSAKIILNYNEIKEDEIDYKSFLPPSTSEKSFVQSFNLNFFGGNNNNKSAYSVNGSTNLSYKENRIKSNWIKSKDNFYFNQLHYGTDINGYKIKTGYITSNSFGYAFTKTSRMLGLEYSTSVETRNDLKVEFSEPLNLFLNQRSAIKIKKDDELIYTAYHDAGNQLISTKNFPSGSYNLNIEIIEDNGSTRIITQFFVKNIVIPPESKGIFYFNTGFMENESFFIEEDLLNIEEINNVNDINLIINNNSKKNDNISILPKVENDLFFKFGHASRFNKQTALYNEVIYKELDYIYNPTLYILGNGYDLKTSFIYGSKNSKGVTLDLNIPIESNNFSLFSKYVNHNDNSLIEDEGISLTASYSLNLYNYGSLSLFTSYNKNPQNKLKNNTYSIGYRKSIYQDNSGALNFNFDISKNNQNTFLNLGFTYNFNSNKNWNIKSSPSYQKIDNESNYNLNNSLRVNGSQNSQTEWYTNLNTNNSKKSKNISINTSISDQRYGTATFDLNHDYTNLSTTTYIGNISTNIVSDFNNITIGGKKSLESGIIVDLTKYKEKDDFELFINDISSDDIKSNKKTFIPLNPYKEYNLYLKSKSKDNFIQVKREINKIVTYPANIQSISWDINRISILSSQLLDQFGNLVNSKPIYVGSNKTYTDEVGYFQIELISSDNLLWTTVNNHKCEFDLNTLEKEDIIYKDQLICYYKDNIKEEEISTYQYKTNEDNNINSNIIDINNLK